MVKTVIGPGGTALINNGYFADFDLYTITLISGPVIRLTTADFDVYDYSSNRYYSGGIGSGVPRINAKQSKTQYHAKRGLDSDTLTVVLAVDVVDQFSGQYTYPDVVGSVPWLAAIRAGLFDGATVAVDRAIFANPIQPPFTVSKCTPGAIVVKWFFGTIGSADANQTAIVLNINDYKYLMGTQMPRNLYQAECRNLLFDSGCTLNQASYAVSGSVQAGSSQTTIVSTVAPPPSSSGTFLLGKMTFTSGKNAGFWFNINAWDGVKTIGLIKPLFYPPTVGDNFTIYPGCDKSTGLNGCGGFNNKINFRAELFTPTPDLVLG